MIAFEDIYKCANAKYVARKDGIEYLSDVVMEEVIGSKNEKDKKLYVYRHQYIPFIPPNSETKNLPIVFYQKNGSKIERIMDNQTSYSNITNLNNILQEMIRLYNRHMEDDTIIVPYRFFIKLVDDVTPNYVGRAKLVMEDRTIFNHLVEPTDIPSAKAFFISKFIDHFIGLNFGAVLKSDSDLEKRFLRFNKKVNVKGLRKNVEEGIMSVNSTYVQNYDFPKLTSRN